MADLPSPSTEKKEPDVVQHIEQVRSNDEKIGFDKDLYTSELLASGHLQVTAEELRKLEERLPDMPVDKAKQVLTDVYHVHVHDPRYDPETLERLRMFTADPDVTAHPDVYGELIYEMRIFALLITTSSPYPEVRAVASDTDDPELPSLTFRVWVIGTLLSAIGCVINAVFALRYPTISISQTAIQLFSCLGMAKFLPRWHVLGHSLNPGPFTKKEHMLITVMCGLGMAWPPTQHLIFAQAMPQYFGMAYARNAGYQFLGALGTNLIGFGFAGLTRRFLVYPSYCVWPFSLSTIALNNALHDQAGSKSAVRGPWGTTWRASMYKCFWVVFGIQFVYYFFPGYIFPNLTIFDWMAWIKPSNGKLVAITSGNFGVGIGINPWLTFDYSYLVNPGGFYPMFIHYNFLAGLTLGFLVAVIFWARNVLNSGYLMLNSPNTFDNKGSKYKVSKIVDSFGRLIPEKYQQYSEPYMGACRLVSMLGTFAYTSGTLTHTLLYNRHELSLGLKGFYQDAKRSFAKLRGKPAEDVGERIHFGDDIHYKLMQAYPEVPEWWFLLVLLGSMTISFVCLGVYTNVSPAVVMMAPIVTLIFIIPVGVVTAVSGLEPSLNVISELIGGAFAAGDTMTVQYFRMFGSEPVYHALIYANDLKMSHYVKIAPRHMFWAQMWGAIIGTVVTVGQWGWLMDLKGVCTEDAPFRLICPAAQADYSTFIFWGTLGAKRLFGPHGRFSFLLVGFPLGIAFPVLMFFLKKRFPRSSILQASHPLLLILSFSWLSGGHWGQYIPGVFINLFSWNFLKVKYLEFWTRYNYVTLAALGAAISINALLVFWTLVFPEVAFPEWWGNPAAQPGCIGNWTNADCALYKIDPARGFFGPEKGSFH